MYIAIHTFIRHRDDVSMYMCIYKTFFFLLFFVDILVLGAENSDVVVLCNVRVEFGNLANFASHVNESIS